jgi:hypothetical protein
MPIPPDSRRLGQPGHVADHNAISDELALLAQGVAGSIPMPSGTAQPFYIPEVVTASPLALKWASGGGGANYDGGSPESGRQPVGNIDGGGP